MSTNTPAEGTTPPTKPETMPSFWWLEPWIFAVQQWNARAKFYAKWKTADEERDNASTALCRIEKRLENYDKAILDTANEAGFTESKYGYAIPGQPHSPCPLTWLGEAVAYWKGEAYAARKQRDEEIRKYCDAMKVIRNADEELSKVRGELEAAKAAQAEADKRAVLAEDKTTGWKLLTPKKKGGRRA